MPSLVICNCTTTHLVTIVDTFDNLGKEPASLGLFQALLLPDVIKQLSVGEVLHSQYELRLCLET
jgi:hypothetical protein